MLACSSHLAPLVGSTGRPRRALRSTTSSTSFCPPARIVRLKRTQSAAALARCRAIRRTLSTGPRRGQRRDPRVAPLGARRNVAQGRASQALSPPRNCPVRRDVLRESNHPEPGRSRAGQPNPSTSAPATAAAHKSSHADYPRPAPFPAPCHRHTSASGGRQSPVSLRANHRSRQHGGCTSTAQCPVGRVEPTTVVPIAIRLRRKRGPP